MNDSRRRSRKARDEATIPAESSAGPVRGFGAVGGSTRKPAAVSVAAEDRLAELAVTNRQLKRKIFDLYTVFEISRNFNSVLNYQNLLDSFILTSLAQVSASKAAIFLRERARSDHFVMAKGKGSPLLQKCRLADLSTTGYRVNSGCLSWKCFQQLRLMNDGQLPKKP